MVLFNSYPLTYVRGIVRREMMKHYAGIAHCAHRISVIWINRSGYYIERVYAQVPDKYNIPKKYYAIPCKVCYERY